MTGVQKEETSPSKSLTSKNSDAAQASKEVLIISCIFGAGFSKLWPAKKNYRSVLFSNNIELKSEAILKGWEFVLVSSLQVSLDPVISSIQSKYVKFLQFFDDFPEYKDYEAYIYHDHKNLFSETELNRLIGMVQEDKSIFMLSSREGWSAAKELKAACTSPRYKQAEEQTVQWINEMVGTRDVNWDAQVYATSFIIYKNLDVISPILNDVYQTIIKLQQPQCQTIWAIIIQSAPNHLQSIHWTETSMIRKTPLPLFKSAIRSIRSAVGLSATKLFRMFGADYENFRKKYVLKIFRASVK